MQDAVIRLAPRQRLLAPVLGTLVGLMQLQLDQVAVAVVIFVITLVGTSAQAGYGVELTPQALVMNGLTRRAIPWSEIEAFEIARAWGATVLRPRLADGSRPRLRAPVTGGPLRDPEFDAKVVRIEEYWEQHTAGRAS
jgi:hypothetical protein